MLHCSLLQQHLQVIVRDVADIVGICSRTEALDGYHKYECCLALSDLNSQQLSQNDEGSQSCSSVQLLIRFFTQRSRKYFTDNQTVFEEIINNGSTSPDHTVYKYQDYSRLLGLVSHGKDDVLGDTWQICLSLFVLKSLEYCDWLQESLSSDGHLTDLQLYLVKLCIHMR